MLKKSMAVFVTVKTTVVSFTGVLYTVTACSVAQAMLGSSIRSARNCT